MSRSVFGRIKLTMTPQKRVPIAPPVVSSSASTATKGPQKRVPIPPPDDADFQARLQIPPDDSSVPKKRQQIPPVAPPTPKTGQPIPTSDASKSADAGQKPPIAPPQPVTSSNASKSADAGQKPPVSPPLPVSKSPQGKPDELLKKLGSELGSTLLDEVGQLKSPHREALVPVFNAANAAVKKGDLAVAQAKVAELKKGLAAVGGDAAALRNIIGELQSSVVDQIGKLPDPYRTDLATMQREALALAHAPDLKGAQEKLAKLRHEIAVAKATVMKFEDLDDDPEAQKQWGVLQAEKAYATQMKKEKSDEYNPKGKFNPKHLQQEADIKDLLKDPTAKAFIKQHKLSEGEAMAIIAYTGVNYKYINPATANQKDKPADFDQATKKYDPEQIDLFKVMSARKAKGVDVTEMEKDLAEYQKKGWLNADNRLDFNNVDKADRGKFAEAVKKYKKTDWMDTQNRPDPSKATTPQEKQQLEKELKEYEESQKKSLYEEGALHTGMVMEALKKLPNYKGPLYRGRRMNPGAFASQYAVGKKVPFESLASFSKNRDRAMYFAVPGDSQNPPAKDATLSVLLEATIPTAKDIQALSLAAHEEECLIPPGTELIVKEHRARAVNHPGVTGGVTVILEVAGMS